MVPPISIKGKKRVVVGKRGQFEISKNKILYRLGGSRTILLLLKPEELSGEINNLPPASEYSTGQLLYKLCEGIMELCFFSLEQEYYIERLVIDFYFKDLLPFTVQGFDTLFYELRYLPRDIYEQFYRLTMSLEDTITTTITTFDENVFNPFKQRFVSAVHNSKDKNPQSVLNQFSRDFPKFFQLHRDLLTILHNQAKQVSDNQQLSFSIFSPILRKIRMLNVLDKHIDIKHGRKGMEISIKPLEIDSRQFEEKLLPLVEP